MPQDQVRVIRDGAAVDLPRNQVSEEEIAAVTAPPPAPFKEPKPGEAASFTGQALRGHFTIPNYAGLVHHEVAAESIGAWVSAALENHQQVTTTVDGNPCEVVAVDAGNMLLDSKGLAIDPYRLVSGDPEATVLSIGPVEEVESQMEQPPMMSVLRLVFSGRRCADRIRHRVSAGLSWLSRVVLADHDLPSHPRCRRLA